MQVVHGTSYHDDTASDVIRVLERARLNEWRLRLFLGDRETGHVWLEENDVIGRIGRSWGPVKVPILLHNRRSTGGGAILDHCILRIVKTSDKRELYRHPDCDMGIFWTDQPTEDMFPDVPELKVRVRHRYRNETEWKNVANFTTWKKAGHYTSFMVGKRMCH